MSNAIYQPPFQAKLEGINSATEGVIPAMSVDEPPRPTNWVRIEYHGRNPDGRHRLTCNDQKFLITGAIYALSKSTNHEGDLLYLKLLLDITPGYRIEPADEHTFDAVCATTDARMFIQGRASACVVKNKA